MRYLNPGETGSSTDKGDDRRKQRRNDQAVTASHFGDHDQSRYGHSRRAGKDRSHADDRESRGIKTGAGDETVSDEANPSTNHPPDIDVGAKEAAGTAG